MLTWNTVSHEIEPCFGNKMNAVNTLALYLHAFKNINVNLKRPLKQTAFANFL